MKRLIILSLLLTACNTIYTNQDASQRDGGGSNPNEPSSICAPVDRVRIVNFPSALSIGTNAGIDVTPKDPFGNSRSDACNEKDGNRWDSNDDTCTVSCPTCFNTTVRGVSNGTCKLNATVAGKSDSVEFPVQ